MKQGECSMGQACVVEPEESVFIEYPRTEVIVIFKTTVLPAVVVPKKSPGRVFLKACLAGLRLAAGIFWLVFMGGFLAAAGEFLLGESKPRPEKSFFALEYHKFLWYMSAV